MNRHLTIVMTAITLLALCSGGCVSLEQYRECQTANRTVNSLLEENRQHLDDAQAANGRLRGKIAALQNAIEQKISDKKLLELAMDSWEENFIALQKQYDQLYAQSQQPPELPVIVLPAEVDQALRELAEQNGDLVDYLPQYGMIKIKSDLTFAKGSAEVNDMAAGTLGELARIVTKSAAQKFHIYVAGHTDDIRISNPATRRKHPTNWHLSVHRALSVIDVLQQAGVDQKRMGAVGFSKYHPVAPNMPGEKGNPFNRRVEIWIVPASRLLTVGSLSDSDAPAPAPRGPVSK